MATYQSTQDPNETDEALEIEIKNLDRERPNLPATVRVAAILKDHQGEQFPVHTTFKAFNIPPASLSGIITTLCYNHWWIDTGHPATGPSYYQIDRVGYVDELVNVRNKFRRGPRNVYRRALKEREAAERAGTYVMPRPRLHRPRKRPGTLRVVQPAPLSPPDQQLDPQPVQQFVQLPVQLPPPRIPAVTAPPTGFRVPAEGDQLLVMLVAGDTIVVNGNSGHELYLLKVIDTNSK